MNPSFDPNQLPLRDIHLPGDIAWWPPAFGWWALGLLLIGIGIALGLRFWRGRRHRAARRMLNEIMAALNTGAEPILCAQQASIVLRRFAMTMEPQSAGIAGMTGERWHEYLVRLARDSALSADESRDLLDLPYVGPERVTSEQVMAMCRACVSWVNARPTRA